MCSFWILFLQHTTWEASQLFFFPNGASLKGDVSQADHSWTRVCKEETSHPVWTQPWPTHERCLPFNSTWLCFCSDPSLTWNQTHCSSPVSPSCVVRCIRMCFSHYFNNVRLWDRTMPHLHLSWGCLTQSHHPSADSFFTRRMKYWVVILKPFYFWPFVTCDVDW